MITCTHSFTPQRWCDCRCNTNHTLSGAREENLQYCTVDASPPLFVGLLSLAGADGTWQVVAAAAGSSLTGSCTITATVTFQGGIAPLTATTSVALVGLTKLAVYALSPDLAAVPAVPPASGLVQGEDVLLLQCQPGGYDQVCAVLVLHRAAEAASSHSRTTATTAAVSETHVAHRDLQPHRV